VFSDHERGGGNTVLHLVWVLASEVTQGYKDTRIQGFLNKDDGYEETA